MTIARPPISGGSAAATRLRKNQSASANRMGNAISSARARSSDTILLAARSAGAPPPSSTPDQPRNARETRSTVFVLSAEGVSTPTANAERPSREIIARDPPWNGVVTLAMPRSAPSRRATSAILAWPAVDATGDPGRTSATMTGLSDRVDWWSRCEALKLSLAGSLAL